MFFKIFKESCKKIYEVCHLAPVNKYSSGT